MSEKEHITESDIRELIQSKNVDLLGTENGFSLAVGFDQSSLPSGKVRGMINSKEDISDVMMRVLKEKLSEADQFRPVVQALKDEIVRLQSELAEKQKEWEQGRDSHAHWLEENGHNPNLVEDLPSEFMKMWSEQINQIKYDIQKLESILASHVTPQLKDKPDDEIIKRLESLEDHENAFHDFMNCYNKNLESIPLTVRLEFARILEKYSK